jgi:hypothetical protein
LGALLFLSKKGMITDSIIKEKFPVEVLTYEGNKIKDLQEKAEFENRQNRLKAVEENGKETVRAESEMMKARQQYGLNSMKRLYAGLLRCARRDGRRGRRCFSVRSIPVFGVPRRDASRLYGIAFLQKKKEQSLAACPLFLMVNG